MASNQTTDYNVTLTILQTQEFNDVGLSSGGSAADRVFILAREVAGSRKTVRLAEIRDYCAKKGYQPDLVDQCVEEYEELNVWQVNQARTTVTFL